MAASRKPVTVRISMHLNQRGKESVCFPSACHDFGQLLLSKAVRKHRKNAGRGVCVTRRFVAIDSLPEPLREKVRVACGK